MGAGRLCPACASTSAAPAARPASSITWSPRESQDLHDCIEWAAAQPWCNGKVGLNGISYYAMNQWRVGALQPPHLAAICVWEGAADYYRDVDAPRRHPLHLPRQLVNDAGRSRAARRRRARPQQPRHRRAGVPDRRRCRTRSSPRNRVDLWAEMRCAHPLDDQYYRERSPRLRRSRCRCCRRPTGAAGPASARQFRGLSGARPRSRNGCEVHGGSHWAPFYTDYGDGAAEALLRPFPQGRGQRLGRSSRRCSCRSAIRREVRAARTRTNGRSRARSGRSSISIRRRSALARAAPAAGAALDYDTLGDGADASRRRSSRRRSRSPGRSPPSCSSRPRPPTPTCSSCCACSIRTARRSLFRARTIRTRRSRRAGCAPRIASSIPSAACPTGPGTPHDES